MVKGACFTDSDDWGDWLVDFIDKQMFKLTDAELKVWLLLYRHHHYGVAKIPFARVREGTGFSQRKINDALSRLRKRKLVTKLGHEEQEAGCLAYRVNPDGEEELKECFDRNGEVHEEDFEGEYDD